MATLIPELEQLAQAGMAMAIDNVRKRARDLASEFQRNPAKFNDAAKKIQALARGRRVRAKSKIHDVQKIGHRAGTSGAKKDQQLNPAKTTYNDCTLYFNEITDIDKTTTNAINGRQGNACFLSGTKLHMRLYNNQSLDPVKVHFAVVSSVGSKTITTSGWFRDYLTSRDKDLSTTLDEIEYDDPINSDKFITHWRTSFILGPMEEYDNTFPRHQGPPSVLEYSKYIPIKRNIRFNDDTDEECESPVFLVWWAKTMVGPGQRLNAYDASIRLVSFFHESLPKTRRFRS